MDVGPLLFDPLELEELELLLEWDTAGGEPLASGGKVKRWKVVEVEVEVEELLRVVVHQSSSMPPVGLPRRLWPFFPLPSSPSLFLLSNERG